jgi:hypothetical protein
VKNNWLAVTIMLLCLLDAAAVAGSEPVLVPYNFKETFEDGTVGAWSSYPPAQDTGYDPTIWIRPLRAVKADNRALYREITPNYEGDALFGVRRKLEMVVDRSSVLKFQAWIKSDRAIRGVKVLFAFADGSCVERTAYFTSRETWVDCTIALSEVIGGAALKHLDAVAFLAICPNADPENLLRFGLDDVVINGRREARWQFTSPATHQLAEWRDAIAGVHFIEGGSLVIAGSAPFRAGSATVTVSRALTGEEEKHFPMQRSRNQDGWSATIPLAERSGVTAGIWRATINAFSAEKKDEAISTSLVFLVKRRDAPAGHPRILMAPGEDANIREKTAAGRMKDIWGELVKRANELRERYRDTHFIYNLDAYDEEYWLPTYNNYIKAISIPAGYIRANGVVYGVCGDPQAGDAARRALLEVADWPSFVHPHLLNQGQFTYWPVGQKLADMAIGYDMVADRFTPAERRKAAQMLYSKGVTEVFKEYVRDNRVSSNTSNWIADVTGGGILCSLAIMDDYSDEDLEPCLTGMILKLNELVKGCFDRDGGYGEGFMYLNHAMYCLNALLPALDRTYGVRFPQKLYKCLDFVLYVFDPETRAIADFGDTSAGVGSLSNFTHVIARTKNPYYKWLYERAPGRQDVDLFFMDDSISSKSPDDLPHMRLFGDVGTAVFRSGFGHTDFGFIFRCGPFFNHQHFDQGTFYLIDRGEPFIMEMGSSDYYLDPWYRKLIVQAGGHNCLLVDDNPESQHAGDFRHDVPAWHAFAEITDFIGFDAGGFVSGRLDPLYRGKLGYLRRSVLFVAPRTVVLIDEVRATSEARTVALRIHPRTRDDITIEGNETRITRPSGVLMMRTIVPAGYEAAVRKRPLTLHEFRGEDLLTMKARGFLELRTALGSGTTTFVNVLSTDPSVMNGLNTEIKSGRVVLSLGGRRYHINTGAGNHVGAPVADGDIVTDALVYSKTPNGYIAMRATTLAVSGEALFTADKPLSVAVREGAVLTLDYSAHERTKLAFGLPGSPERVSLGGKNHGSWSYAPQTGLVIELAAGNGVLGIR